MASSQINISKKPKIGATLRNPRDKDIIRMVPKVTSVIRARKINIGKMTQLNTALSRNILLSLLVSYQSFLLYILPLNSGSSKPDNHKYPFSAGKNEYCWEKYPNSHVLLPI